VLLRARAVENLCFVAAPDQTGTHPPDRRCFGHSLIVGPWGTVLADAGEDVGIVSAELDFAEVDRVREGLPSPAHRRPDLYRGWE
jgi:predicted amidohydrolase